MAFAIGSGHDGAAELKNRLKALDSQISKLGLPESDFRPPTPRIQLRRAPIMSSFTSNDIDFCVYALNRLRRRLSDIPKSDANFAKIRTEIERLMKTVERVARRHGESVAWDAA